MGVVLFQPNGWMAWMNMEIMKEVLAQLNERLKREKQNILLFLDNASCHPPSIGDKLSNITIKFLPKNTTAKTQPLNAGIIANWKVKYKEILNNIRYVCFKAYRVKNASEIVSAWNEVSPATIVKCF